MPAGLQRGQAGQGQAGLNAARWLAAPAWMAGGRWQAGFGCAPGLPSPSRRALEMVNREGSGAALRKPGDPTSAEAHACPSASCAVTSSSGSWRSRSACTVLMAGLIILRPAGKAEQSRPGRAYDTGACAGSPHWRPTPAAVPASEQDLLPVRPALGRCASETTARPTGPTEGLHLLPGPRSELHILFAGMKGVRGGGSHFVQVIRKLSQGELARWLAWGLTSW